MKDSRIAAAELLEAVASDLDTIFGSLLELGVEVAAAYRTAGGLEPGTTSEDLLPLRSLIAQMLEEHDSYVGGLGFLARPGLLSDAQMFVEWWCAGASQAYPLQPPLDPEHPFFHDYERFEWFVGPWTVGSKRIVGPWVDCLGTGEHAMTLSVPVFGGDSGHEFLGVAGADLRVRRVERTAIARLSSIPRDVALVNGEGRIIASNTSRLLAGSLLEESDARWAAEAGAGWTRRGDGAEAIAHRTLPWTVVLFPPRSVRPTLP